MNNLEAASIKERIILATITCMERDGIQSTTIRRIAREAGVNIAAINYYFRSKDRLIEEALKATLEHVFSDWEQMLQAEKQDFRGRLREILTYTIEGMLRYPGITRAHLYDPLLQGSSDNPFVRRLNTFLNDLLATMEAEGPSATGVQLRLSLMQMMSAATFVGLMPEFFGDFAGIDLTVPEARQTYVEHLVSHFLP